MGKTRRRDNPSVVAAAALFFPCDKRTLIFTATLPRASAAIIEKVAMKGKIPVQYFQISREARTWVRVEKERARRRV